MLKINSQSLKDLETLVPGTLHFLITHIITEDLPKLSPTPTTRSIQITFSHRWQGSGTEVKLVKMKHLYIHVMGCDVYCICNGIYFEISQTGQEQLISRVKRNFKNLWTL